MPVVNCILNKVGWDCDEFVCIDAENCPSCNKDCLKYDQCKYCNFNMNDDEE